MSRMHGIPAVLDRNGVAVITGGASGFGYEVATRLLKSGMAVAILDVSAKELREAQIRLSIIAAEAKTVILPVLCNVTKMADCVGARAKVDAAFPSKKISFLFNNAGIQGKAGMSILTGASEHWKPIFEVNVFGVLNIIQAFVPKIIEDGPLPSGLKTHVVTTSSVVGLLNHNIGAYSVSKMATTAVCEQFAIELEGLGERALHIFPHSLHPTVAATNFMMNSDSEGNAQIDASIKEMLLAKGGTSKADDIVDGLFRGLDAGDYYIIVDGKLDLPTGLQLSNRFADQITQGRPRKPEQLGALAQFGWTADQLKERLAKIGKSKL